MEVIEKVIPRNCSLNFSFQNCPNLCLGYWNGNVIGTPMECNLRLPVIVLTVQCATFFNVVRCYSKG